MARLALFDLDHTLLDGDSDVLWCEFLIERGVLDAASFGARNAQMERGYRAGSVSAQDFCAFYVSTLSARPRAAVGSPAARVPRHSDRAAHRGGGAGAGAAPSRRRRSAGDDDRHQPLHHRADRRAPRHRTPDRHRMRGRCRRQLHRPHAGRAEHARGQGRAPAGVAGAARPGVGRLRRHVLQRFDQRPAAAGGGAAPGGDQPRCAAGREAAERGWPVVWLHGAGRTA